MKHLYGLVSSVLKNRVGSEAPPGLMTDAAVEQPSPQLAPVPPWPAPSTKKMASGLILYP